MSAPTQPITGVVSRGQIISTPDWLCRSLIRGNIVNEVNREYVVGEGVQQQRATGVLHR